MNREEQAHSSIPIAILAAGASSRMGSHKLLLELAGRPLIAWAVSAANASRAASVIVIVGRDAEAAKSALPGGREKAVTNEYALNGQATSLAQAVASLRASAPGIAILLADQPFMDTRSINLVLEVAEQTTTRVALGVYGNQSGHPVYLPRRLFPAIAALHGDTGARDIIASERPNITQVPLSNALAHFDVDSPEDYARALELAYRLALPDA